jgi:hypothetical protein
VWLKWMSAMTGMGDWATIVRSASTSRSRGTATRTMSAPASATVRIWRMVASRLAVSVLVIGLDGHGRAAPDGDAADVELPLGGHGSSVRTDPAAGWARYRRPGAAAGAPSPTPVRAWTRSHRSPPTAGSRTRGSASATVGRPGGAGGRPA